ncbi:hypothetical protein BDY17DRAFT_292143 [Neohortaea acidophila]|uniref:Uncharacterized protein n=1 Tax=Neohortaea acidophila TaxID=245834 RepID=A0A6A6Q3E4_9PEZI|nr:uncharacterized protein BDY17DRAFT_292143 [Neohortaea acidophila]KAF2486805.1 hypothetical protein BDY17DRAFT_292143 [Neohortaea acidophila]
MTSNQDPHQGGDLSDMAAKGTKMPNDAGDYEVLPSVPDEHQKAENPAFHNQFINSADPQGAVDNAVDMPRRFNDSGATGEVITGTGDQMPVDVEQKRFGLDEAGGPAAKGHSRDGKASSKHHKDEFGRFAGEGAEVDPAPGEEELEQDEIRDSKGV